MRNSSSSDKEIILKKHYVILILLFFTQGMTYALNDMPLLAQLQGEHNMSAFGFSIVNLDFNHDGFDDLIVLSAGYGYQYQQTPARGKVYIYYGGPGFSSASEPSITLEGDYPVGMQRTIDWIVNVGDINGDSFDDLMIEDAIPNVSSSTRYMFFFGGTIDLLTPNLINIDDINETIYAHYKLGDIDGDGFDDIGIKYRLNSIYCFDIQWGGSFNRQIVYSDSDILSYASFIGGIGDINDDGYKDFTIGYVGDVSVPPSNIIELYHGSHERVFTNTMVLINTQTSITRRCKALGDINDDGYDDFFAFANTEGLMLWYGNDFLDPTHPDIALNPVYYGSDSVRGIDAGDVNGDGFSDIVGASYPQQRFAVWLGSPSMNGQADWQKTSTLDNYCYDLAMGDYNGDGYCDVAVSAPFEEGIWPNHDFRGYVQIYEGNPGMVVDDDPIAPNLSNHGQMKISPNPIRNANEISIALTSTIIGNGNPVVIEVFNLKGQIVYRSEFIRMSSAELISTVNLANYPSGVYVCRARIGNRSTSKKFTIIK